MFKFELQAVLSLKEKLEEAKVRELGLANTKKEQLLIQKSSLISAERQVEEALRKEHSSIIDIRKIKVLNNYGDILEKQIQKKEDEIKVAEKEVLKKQNEFLEAMKERKILDNLKDIQFEQYQEEDSKSERQIIDEIVSFKYGSVKRSEI